MKKALIGLLIALSIVLCTGTVIYFFLPAVVVKSALSVVRCSAGLSRHEVQVDDHRWVYLEGGKGDVVLFLHGYGDSKDGWGEFPAALRGQYRLIIPDLPGFGENSRVPADTYGIPEQVKRLDRFAEALGIQSFHLIGMSMGGGIASYYAGDHPDKVKSLMIMGALGVRSEKPSEVFLAYEKDKTESLYYKTEKGFHQLLEWGFDRPPQLPRPFIVYAVEMAKDRYDFNRKVAEKLVKDGFGILENRLSMITAPTLIVWGKNDRIFRVSSGEVFKRGIKNSRLEILDGGHMIFFDEPAKTISLYKDFLRNLK